MHILIFVLLLFQTILPAQTMATNSDVSSSAIHYYTVYPVNNLDTEQANKIQSSLEDICGTQNVIPYRQDNIKRSKSISYWTVVTYHIDDFADNLRSVEGVREVKQIDPREQHHIDVRGQLADFSESPQSTHADLHRRNVAKYFAIAKKDSDVNKTEEFLRTQVEGGRRFRQMMGSGRVVGWAQLMLSAAAKEAVEKHEGIASIRLDGKVAEFFAIPPHVRRRSNTIRREYTERARLSTRAKSWQKQSGADKALVMDSQYPGADLNNLKDYVYPTEAGKGSYIYMIDRGVRLGAVNPNNDYEFRQPNRDPAHFDVLQTMESILQREDKYENDSGTKSHGTFAASKALGSQFGVAKEATLISVKMTDDETDYENAFNLIIDHIQHNRGHIRSVVLLDSGSQESTTREQARATADWLPIYVDPMQVLFRMGVPIMCAVGNFGQEANRHNVDTRPQVYEDTDFPLINVGAADYAGERYVKSQQGPQVTIWAPGVDIEGMSQEEMHSAITSGTSVAAPQVAGLIATYLSDPQISLRWRIMSGVDRVKAIRQYLTSDASSWARNSNLRMIWNGATKDDHDTAGASSSPPSQVPPSQPEKTKALSIVLQNMITEAFNENSWLFYATAKGKSAVCDSKASRLLTSPASNDPSFIDKLAWPGGVHKLKVDGMDCEYKNNGDNAGALCCNGRQGPISCQGDIMMSKEVKAKKCDLGIYERGAVVCEW